MASRSEIVVGGLVVSHDQQSIQVTSSQTGVSVSHAIVRGAPMPWSGQPSDRTALAPVHPAMLDSAIGTILDRVLKSRALGVASATSGVTMATAAAVAVFLLGAPAFMLAAWVPATLLLTAGGFLAFRRGPSAGEVSESRVLESAHQRGGTLTVATLALDTGRSMADCQKQLDAMVAAGWVTMDVDGDGLLTYHIASLDRQGRGSGTSKILPIKDPRR